MRHILSAVLALVLVICLVGSVSAATSPGQYDVVDLLAAGFFPNGEPVVSKSATLYSFDWEVTTSVSFRYVYLNVYAPSTPSSVTFNGITGTLVHSGAFYQYRFTLNKVVTDCSISIKFSSSAYRTVSIGYAIGTVSGQEVFTSFSMFSRGFNATTWSKTASNSIPFSGSYGSNISNPPTTGSIVNSFIFCFNPTVASADYFTIHLVVPPGHKTGDTEWMSPWAHDPGFYIGTSSGTSPSIVSPLPIIASESYYDSATSVASFRGAYHFIYTVDVSGFDLSAYDIMCSIDLIGAKMGDTDRYGFYFKVLSACVGVNADDGSPWRAFTTWLSTQFTNLKTSVSSLGTTIINQFTALKTSLSGWFTNLQNTIKNAINPPGETVPSDEFSEAAGGIDNFEQSQMDSIDSNMGQISSSVSLSGIGASLAFIQRYTNGIFSGLGDAALLFTFPLFLGIFFYLCSRVPNNTHHRKDDDNS